jgi:F-type H+-transporting ATPase subunit a
MTRGRGAAASPAGGNVTTDTRKGAGGISDPLYIGLLIIIVLVVDVFAFLVAPPFDKETGGAVACQFPVCYINGNLELPAPHVVWGPQPDPSFVTFQLNITSTLVTMVIITLLVILLLWATSRGERPVPGRWQNVMEYAWEQIESFGMSLGGPAAKPYIMLFAGFLLLIVFFNWSGLVPPIGKIDELRAPTSDINVTIGLALVAFVIIEYQGFHHLGIRGYLGKFFPFREFRHGVVSGSIALFVGLTELMLEFVKPVTLSMRLFGNIYGGEVALGVLTALTVAIVPMAMLALELLLNLVQALIFSTLTLMFILIAIEGHEEEHESAKDVESTTHAIETAGAH